MKLLSAALATSCLFSLRGFAADTTHLVADADRIKESIDRAIDDDANDSMGRRRERIYEATVEGLAFMKQVCADQSLTAAQKSDLTLNVGGEIGRAFYDATSLLYKASLVSDPGVLDKQEGEHRYSPSYLYRTTLRWLAVAGYGLGRDVVSAVNPLRIQPPLLPEGWKADDPSRAPGQSLVARLRGRVPDAIPFLGSSNSISRWAKRMARSIDATYQEMANWSDANARQAGMDAIARIFSSTDVNGKSTEDGADDSRPMMDGPQNSFQRGFYVLLGLVMARYGWDMMDAGAQYTTQAGIMLSHMTWLATAGVFYFGRTGNSAYKAYRRLQAIADDMKVRNAHVFHGRDADYGSRADDDTAGLCNSTLKRRRD